MISSKKKIALVPKYDWSRIGQRLNLGLCCLNTILREQKPSIFCSRTCNRKNFTVEIAQAKALQNIADIIKLIEWNEKNHIKCLRISSDLFPHYTDPDTPPYTMDFAYPLLKEVGDLAKKYGHRLVMHPAQFNQVGAENPAVLLRTIEDLKYNADILDAMGIDENGVLIVHGGGTYGNLAVTKDRWIQQFQVLPDNVKRRLVIENCERCYSTQDCLQIAEACQIPLVFDFHHYACWSIVYGKDSQKSIRELMPAILKTWGQRRVLMHVSEQAEGKKIGAHSDYVETLPDDLLWTLTNFDVQIDLEIEAKMKEQAILRLYKSYPQIFDFTSPLTSTKKEFKWKPAYVYTTYMIVKSAIIDCKIPIKFKAPTLPEETSTLPEETSTLPEETSTLPEEIPAEVDKSPNLVKIPLKMKTKIA